MEKILTQPANDQKLLQPPCTYYRLESPTQRPEDARLQEKSLEIWGRPARGSDQPKVKAYVGSLPSDKRGVEFTTDVEPDPNTPPGFAFWSGSRDGVIIREDIAILSVLTVVNLQP
jgi:hypothetical protein